MMATEWTSDVDLDGMFEAMRDFKPWCVVTGSRRRRPRAPRTVAMLEGRQLSFDFSPIGGR